MVPDSPELASDGEDHTLSPQVMGPDEISGQITPTPLDSPRWMSLGLGLQRPAIPWLTASAIALAFVLTMASDLTFYDSPELALVAYQLGLGHPIGQPLHTLLGHLFAHLPGLSALAGLTLLSALPAALTALPLFSIAEHLTRRLQAPGAEGGRAQPSKKRGASLIVAAVTLAFCLHPIPWENATRVEVYSLSQALGLWALALGLRASERAAKPGLRAAREWMWVGLCLGLAGSANLVIGAIYAASLLPLVIAQVLPPHGRGPSGPLGWVAGGALGLTLYAYVPLVAGRQDVIVWGAPTDSSSLWAYLSGADYSHNQGIEWGPFVDHLWRLMTSMVGSGAAIFALLGAGIWLAFSWGSRTDRSQPQSEEKPPSTRPPSTKSPVALGLSLPILACLSFSFVAMNVVFHPDVPNYQGYLAGPFLLTGAAWAAALSVGWAQGGRFRLYASFMALVLLLPLLIPPTLAQRSRAGASLGRTMVDGLLNEAPEGAIVLIEADHWVAPLLYVQEVEARRTDLVIVARGLASSSWYWAFLMRRHPDLHPFALRGPGGRDARIGRLVSANAGRPLLVEHRGLASAIEGSACDMGWLLWMGPACGPQYTRPDPTIAASALEHPWPLGESREVAARVGYARGVALWQLGRGQDAALAFWSGLPPEGRPPLPPLPAHMRPLGGAPTSWTRAAALHDPARNLLMLAHLMAAGDQPNAAFSFAQAAHRRGLPEARPALTHFRDRLVNPSTQRQ